MRKSLIGLVLAVISAGLSGCFISQTSLITPEEAAFPFNRIVYTQNDDADELTLVREGDAYAMATDEAKVLVRFKLIRDNYYVAQMGSEKPEEGWLLALLKVDLPAGTVNAYKMIGTEADVAPGLTLCEQTICVASVQDYANHAIAAVEAGGQPDIVYTIKSTE